MKNQDMKLMFVAFLEWFTTLAFQMVALRKAVPFVWSSVVLTSIVIGIILLALSAWYFAGWKLTSTMSEHSLLKRLCIYLLISAVYYLLIVYPSFTTVLQTLLHTIWYIPTLFAFSLLFFAVPTFLASHTMPIITHISQWTKWYAAWKILFISTIWSFLGSTLTTLFLFPYMWVYRTWIFASIILVVCAILVWTWKWVMKVWSSTLVVIIFSAQLFRPWAQWYYEETPYQTVHIAEWNLKWKNVRVMELNWWWASSIDIDTKRSFFPYVRTIVDVIKDKKPKTIAVIWAAWCTLPQEVAQLDFVENIDVIDIDARVFPIATQYFLQESLHPKIIPIVQSARGWIYDMTQVSKKYDMIIIDAYNGTSLPDELVTKEFFAWLKQLSPNLMINMISDKRLVTPFSQYFLATIQDVFPTVVYADASSTPADYPLGNMILATFDVWTMQATPHYTNDLFTDDKNNVDALRVAVMYGTP
jgi:Spermine/spermidine synthase domain